MQVSYYAKKYGVWSMQPNGVRPDFTKCAASVITKKGNCASEHQCRNKCGHGPGESFCKSHAKQYEHA